VCRRHTRFGKVSHVAGAKLDRLAAPAVSSGDAIWLEPSRRVSALGGLARTEARLTHSPQAPVEPGGVGNRNKRREPDEGEAITGRGQDPRRD
jgi:hypothetical protein